MGCFPCSGESSSSTTTTTTINNKKRVKKRDYNINGTSNRSYDHVKSPSGLLDRPKVIPDDFIKDEPEVVNQTVPENTAGEQDVSKSPCSDGEAEGIKARTFPFADLVAATQNFKLEYFLGEGGFGKVYKGHLQDTGEVVAIKQLDRNGCQGIKEFVVEVKTLSKARHDNLVKLIGCCAEGDQRLLVYDYMPLGSLEDHLYDPPANKKRLDWNTRMKIAAGSAKGLEYLHNKMNPPIIYRDLKCSNILLDEGYHAKLSDFGLAKVGPSGDQTHVSTRVMGTYGYCAPDYAMTGQLTFKSDIYSFGVVLLELITGRRAIDNRRPGAEQNLVAWARPLFKDRKKFCQMADPTLEGRFPIRGLYQALAIAAMCVQEQPNMRPQIVDIVKALSYLATQAYDPHVHRLNNMGQGLSPRSHKRENGEQSRVTDNEIEKIDLED